MELEMKREELIQDTKINKPHVVLLGAGASRAAFPNGEANSKQLPLMNDFVDALHLTALLKNANIDPTENFESIYARIEDNALRENLEERINKYFTQLRLQSTVTDYDRLLLSLREKDAIFTFNWDPFLFDAYQRNRHISAKLPEIFFLYGNVRIGSCLAHQQWGARGQQCPICRNQFTDVPLLYPLKKKIIQTINT